MSRLDNEDVSADRHLNVGRDAMDALVRRRCAPACTVKPCGPVPPTLGSIPGSRARGDGG